MSEEEIRIRPRHPTSYYVPFDVTQLHHLAEYNTMNVVLIHCLRYEYLM